MLRAGLMRQAPGRRLCYLPLGTRVVRRLADRLLGRMVDAGAQEVLLPGGTLGEENPSERHLAVARLLKGLIGSYRQLPLTLCQVRLQSNPKGSDVPAFLRPRQALLGEAYGLSLQRDADDACHDAMSEVLRRTCEDCGFPFHVVEAACDEAGTPCAHRFLVPAPMGTQRYVRCPDCGYAGTRESARLPEAELSPPAEAPQPREVETPGRTSVHAVSRFLDAEPRDLLKTILYVADARPVAALVRGDHKVNEGKLKRALGAEELTLADGRVVEKITTAPVGFAGPTGLNEVQLVADYAVASMNSAITGANKNDAHLVGVVPGRDFQPDVLADVRFAEADDHCWQCGSPLGMFDGIEVATIEDLGTRPAEAAGLGCAVAAGGEEAPRMVYHSVSLAAALAAMVETGAEGKSIHWPPEMAPFQVVVMPLDMADEEITAAAEEAYDLLRKEGLAALLDDREERPGVKFNDARLIGFPLRVVVGRGVRRSGRLELQVRGAKAQTDVCPDRIVEAVRQRLEEMSRRFEPVRAEATQ